MRGVVDLDEVVLADVARHRSLGHAVRAEGVSAARVEGDAVQLQRLVRNLLDNAARHATSAVTVTLGEEAGDAVLRVDDDGPGIPAGDRERVFERFARLDEGRTRATGGAGLGLSLVKAVAVSHGGSVDVRGRTGSGGALRGPTPPGRGRRARHSLTTSVERVTDRCTGCNDP